MQFATTSIFCSHNNVSVFHSPHFVAVFLFLHIKFSVAATNVHLIFCSIIVFSFNPHTAMLYISHTMHVSYEINLHLFIPVDLLLWSWHFWSREFYAYCSWNCLRIFHCFNLPVCNNLHVRHILISMLVYTLLLKRMNCTFGDDMKQHLSNLQSAFWVWLFTSLFCKRESMRNLQHPSLKLHEMIFSKRCLKQTLIIMIINDAQEKRNLLFQEEPHNLIFQGLLVNWHSSLMLTSCSSYICTIGNKIVETLYSNKVTSENKRIYTPPPSSPLKVGEFVVFYR